MSGHGRGLAPSSWVVRFAPLVRAGGSVLDVACGVGRHARFFASRGHAVLGVDRDDAALADLAATPGVSVRRADLEGAAWPFDGERFDAIVVTNYLHCPLFTPISHALAEGGVLLYETFMAGNERIRKPSNPAFLLQHGELLSAFGALTVVAFEQGQTAAPHEAIVQRLCARRARADATPLP